MKLEAQSRKSNGLRGLLGTLWGKQAENEFIISTKIDIKCSKD